MKLALRHPVQLLRWERRLRMSALLYDAPFPFLFTYSFEQAILIVSLGFLVPVTSCQDKHTIRYRNPKA